MLFWFLIIFISLAALLPVCIGLARQGRQAVASGDHDRSLYEARIAEIDSDVTMGRLDEEAAKAAKAEEGRKLLRLAEGRSPQVSAANLRSAMAPALAFVIVVVPLASIFVYQALGTPPGTSLTPPASEQASQGGQSMGELLASAEARLKERPDEVQGWRVVAPVYMRLGRFGDAKEAFRNLIRLEGEQPGLLVGLAEAHILASNRDIDGEAIDLLRRTLEIDPQNARARFLSGAAALQNGDEEQAKAIWQDMLEGAKGDEPWFNAVRSNLASLNESEQAPSASAPAQPSAPAAGRFTPEQMEQVNAMVTGLAERLEEEKGTQADWERLVRSYMVLQRPQDASAALKRAGELFPDDGDFLARLNSMVSGEGNQ